MAKTNHHERIHATADSRFNHGGWRSEASEFTSEYVRVDLLDANVQALVNTVELLIAGSFDEPRFAGVRAALAHFKEKHNDQSNK